MEQIILQTVMAVIGSLGFAIFFNTKGRKLILIAIGSAVCTLTYFYVFIRTGDKVISTLFGAIMVAAIAEIMARIIKTPVIILLVPMMIPLVPGGDLYYSMRDFILGDTVAFGLSFQIMLKEAAAIAFGIILASFVVQIILKSRKYLGKKTEKKTKYKTYRHIF